MYYSISKRHKGFTLVEMIVSLAIFSVVATVALGALVSIISANKKAQTLQSSISNLNFALESMSREMRVGGVYHCEGTPPITFDTAPMSPLSCFLGQNQFIAFESSKKRLDKDDASPYSCSSVVGYKFERVDPGVNEWILKRAESEYCNAQLGDSENPFVPIVSPEDVVITDFDVEVTNDLYPKAFIRISGHTGVKEKEKTDFVVQTAVSPRLLQGN